MFLYLEQFQWSWLFLWHNKENVRGSTLRERALQLCSLIVVWLQQSGGLDRLVDV